MARWVMLLRDYDFTIPYCKGEHQVVADALSRLLWKSHLQSRSEITDEDATTLNSIIHTDHFHLLWSLEWTELIQHALILSQRENGPLLHTIDLLSLDPKFKTHLKKFANEFSLDDDDALLHTTDTQSVSYILLNARADKIASFHKQQGHLVAKPLNDIICHRVWWPQIHVDLQNDINHCPQCQLHRRRSTTPCAPQHSLPFQWQPFRVWAMDFIGRLPPSGMHPPVPLDPHLSQSRHRLANRHPLGRRYRTVYCASPLRPRLHGTWHACRNPF